MKRACGNCGWAKTVDVIPGETLCKAWGETRRRHPKWEACALWKSEKDWRGETCGTCEFRGGDSCWCGPGTRDAPVRQHACTEWMPREE